MENFGEPISKEDAVSEHEKRAFIEMQRQIETTKNDISEDLHLQKEIGELIESLPTEQERDVIRLRFLENKTRKEIEEKLKLSRERVRTIEIVALRKLRHPRRENIISGVELTNKSYRERLRNIIFIPLFSSQIEENKKMEKVLHEIDYLTWSGEARLHFNELGSLFFNQIYDETKAILSKEKYTDQDVVALKAIAKRLDKEIKRISPTTS